MIDLLGSGFAEIQKSMEKLIVDKRIFTAGKQLLTLVAGVIVPYVIANENIDLFLVKPLQRLQIRLDAGIEFVVTGGKGVGTGTAERTHSVGLSVFGELVCCGKIDHYIVVVAGIKGNFVGSF